MKLKLLLDDIATISAVGFVSWLLGRFVLFHIRIFGATDEYMIGMLNNPIGIILSIAMGILILFVLFLIYTLIKKRYFDEESGS